MKTRDLAHKVPCEKSPAQTERVGGALYVATDLRSWRTEEPLAFCRDVQINDTAYRRLDPEYFAWLRSRLTLAEEAAGLGRIDPAGFEELRGRFQAIEAWALDHFGPQAVLAAIRTLEPGVYVPPRAEADGRRPQPPARDDEKIKRAIRLVDAIRDRALELGWSLERLYRHKGFHNRPFAAEYGLVCYLGPQDRIGEVASRSIEIILPNNVRQRFYNPEAGQPWIRRTSREKS
jgi:hypothetical protein